MSENTNKKSYMTIGKLDIHPSNPYWEKMLSGNLILVFGGGSWYLAVEEDKDE